MKVFAAEVLIELGRVYSESGQPELAVESYGTAMDGHSDEGARPDLWVYRGEAYLRNGDDAAAIRDFDRALRLSGNDIGSRYVVGLRGQAYAGLGEFGRAVSDYDVCLEEFIGDREELTRLRSLALSSLEKASETE